MNKENELKELQEIFEKDNDNDRVCDYTRFFIKKEGFSDNLIMDKEKPSLKILCCPSDIPSYEYFFKEKRFTSLEEVKNKIIKDLKFEEIKNHFDSANYAFKYNLFAKTVEPLLEEKTPIEMSFDQALSYFLNNGYYGNDEWILLFPSFYEFQISDDLKEKLKKSGIVLLLHNIKSLEQYTFFYKKNSVFGEKPEIIDYKVKSFIDSPYELNYKNEILFTFLYSPLKIISKDDFYVIKLKSEFDQSFESTLKF